MFSDGFNLLAYKTKPAKTKLGRLAFPALIIGIIVFSIGFGTYALLEPLAETGETNLISIYLIALLSIVALLEGIYKVPSLLFDCQDNNLLLSLPIPKQRVFALRVAKLLAFQIAYNAIFMVPAFVAYAVLLTPGPNFYLFSALMLILTPLIPTALAVVIGYVVKALSIGFKHRNISQTILTFVAIMLLMLIIGNWQTIVLSFEEGPAGSISELIGAIYYPASAYSRLIVGFNWLDFLGLLASTILPLISVIYLCSIRYFKVISKNSAISVENSTGKSIRKTEISALKSSSKTWALVKKELSRISVSSVFMVNTLFGPVLLLFVTIVAGVNIDTFVGLFSNGEEVAITSEDVILLAPLFYIGGLILMCAMTSITSSMISIEGKSFNVTKSLPVSPKQVLRSKLLASLLLALPLFFLSSFIFILDFRPSLEYSILIFLTPVLALTITGIIGLLMNLSHPKFDAASDAEVVKQSASSMLSVFIGMGIGLASVALLVFLSIFTPLDAPLILAIIYLIADLILLKLLYARGCRQFSQLTF